MSTHTADTAAIEVHYSALETANKVVENSEELVKMYSSDSGASTGVDKTAIDTQEVKFYSDRLATIETTLPHTMQGKLHDKQHAIYAFRKVNRMCWIVAHLRVVEMAARGELRLVRTNKARPSLVVMEEPSHSFAYIVFTAQQTSVRCFKS